MPRSALARVERRPSPADWADDASMTLAEAAAVFGSDYPLTVSTLRTEIRRGRLTYAEVAGTFFVTPAAIRALFQPCLAKPKAPASTYAPPGPIGRPKPSGSSETERAKSARAALRLALQTPSAGSPTTSPASTSRRGPAPVTPLRS